MQLRRRLTWSLPSEPENEPNSTAAPLATTSEFQPDNDRLRSSQAPTRAETDRVFRACPPSDALWRGPRPVAGGCQRPRIAQIRLASSDRPIHSLLSPVFPLAMRNTD